MVLWLLASLAGAHPGSFRLAAHDLAVVADGDTLMLEYYLEVPRLRPEQHDAPANEVVPGIAELQSGFRVLFDGEVVPVEPVDDPVYRTSHTMAGIEATFRVALPTGVHEVTVENGNYPDLPGLFRTGWALDGTRRLEQSTLIDLDGHDVTADRSRDYVLGDEARTSTVRWRDRSRLEPWFVPVPHSPVSAVATLQPDLVTAWSTGHPHAVLTLIALALAPLTGCTARVPDEAGAFGGLGLGVALGAVGAVCGAFVPSTWLATSLVVVCLLPIIPRLRGAAAWTALLALACVPSLWPWSVIVGAIGGALSRPMKPSRLDRVALGIGGVLALCWALRLF